MICKQCGAPLKNNKCEYCGTNNGLNGSLMNMQGELNINGETIKVYVAKEELMDNSIVGYTERNGQLQRLKKMTARKFTLIEV